MEIVLGRVRTLDERVQHALDSLSPQALAILTRGSFVAGEYIPLRLIIELSENAPLHARLNMRNDLRIMQEVDSLVSLKGRDGAVIYIPPAMTRAAYEQIVVGVSPRVADCILGKCMADLAFGRQHSDVLPMICSVSAMAVMTKITDTYARLVRRFDPIPLEHLERFDNLATSFAAMFWKHMMTPIAVYGDVPSDHLAVQALVRALLMVSYSHLCAENWEMAKRRVLCAQHVAKNTSLQPPKATTKKWDEDITTYKDAFLRSELNWMKCLLKYAALQVNPREVIEQDLEEFASAQEYWDTRRKEGVEEAADGNDPWDEEDINMDPIPCGE